MKTKGRRQSSNVQDMRGREGSVSEWQVQASIKPEPIIPKRVEDDMAVAAARSRQSQEMQDRIKGRTRINSATYTEIVKSRLRKGR